MTAQTVIDPAETAIRSLIDDWLDAFHRRDLDRLMRCYTPDVRAFDAIAALQFQGRDAYGKHWAACLDMCPGSLIGELDQVVVESDGRLGFAHMLFRCGMVDDGGEERSSWMRFTLCLRLADGHWRIAHEHVSAPFDPEAGKVLFDLTP